MEEKYDFRAIEAKWQARWERDKTFRAPDSSPRPKYYTLEMFPYPSGSGLHVGHCKNYAPNDAFCRFTSMSGYNVLHPMGWDAFGQPAENEAIKRGRNPREMVPEYAASYKRTLKLIGCSYDWDREINSSDPAYYKWTQRFFLLLYKRGLAYRATAPINWCPSCKTGLANEEVREGRCWRCDTPVEKRPMPQWFFKITAYADRLLADLEKIDWSDGLKEMQRDWIGRSEGAEIHFAVESRESRVESVTTRSATLDSASIDARDSRLATRDSITVFTTRPDTLFGATFMVLAPEHPLVGALTTPDRKDEVDAYVKRAQSTAEMDRLNAERAKTGVFIGSYAINPATNAPIPIWIADYVLMGYGTGAIMAVPAHDQRDFEFARKFELPIRLVYADASGPIDEDEMTKALPHGGIVINSGQFDGLPNARATIRKFTEWLEQIAKGKGTVNYRLRDWLISRQRYWGAPIPIVHCAACGEVPVPEDQLPVLLPDVVEYQPSGTGESPLATIPEFVNTTCPSCGGPAKRETDTMGGYACSSWYFLRYADPRNEHGFAARDKVDYWLPVDTYAGGVEHARSHLFYSRFWTKVAFDAGFVGFEEPFLTLKNQGSLLALTLGRRPRSGEDIINEEADESVSDWIILSPAEREKFPPDHPVWLQIKEWAIAKDREAIESQIEEKYGIVPRWSRMSKSKGNVVTPEEIAEQHGADSLRLYVMFLAPFEDDVQWTQDGINGSYRFLNRVWRWAMMALESYRSDWRYNIDSSPSSPIRRKLHQTIRKVGEDIASFRFNTAIAALMGLVNELYAAWPLDAEAVEFGDPALSEALETLTLLLAPFAPHLADELWERMGKDGSTYHAAWPKSDPIVAADAEITVVVQVNGKVRDRLTVPADATDDMIQDLALATPAVIESLNGKQVRKVIVIPKKLVNVVIG